MVVKNTKVFPARMYGRKEKTGAKIEVFLLRELNKPNRLWDVIVDPARKIRVGNKLYFGDNDELVAEVIDNTTSRGRTIRFLWEGTDEEFRQVLEILGETPLPKYIKRKPDEEDRERYQTVYAKHKGAVAAPIAGFHFSPQLIKRCEIKGIRFAEITLHSGLGTFRPMEVEDLHKHKMDAEYYKIDEAACNIVNKAKEEARRLGNSLWSRTAQISTLPNMGIICANMFAALSGMFDLASKRDAMLSSGVPDLVMYLLFFLALVISFIGGFTTPVIGTKEWVVITGFILLACIIIYITLDLSRPMRGFIRPDVGQERIEQLQKMF
jgi:uncharacterized membrane protein